MTKERFKELSHAVAVFVFESSAFSSESDAPIIEGKDGKYTIHHVLRGLDAKINVTNVFDGKKVSLIKTLPDDYLEFEIIGVIVVSYVIMGVAIVVRRRL